MLLNGKWYEAIVIYRGIKIGGEIEVWLDKDSADRLFNALVRIRDDNPIDNSNGGLES